MVKLTPVCRSCGAQLVAGHKDDPEYHWDWCNRKTLRGRLGRGNTALLSKRQCLTNDGPRQGDHHGPLRPP